MRFQTLGSFVLLAMITACSSGTATPGMTLLTGLRGYHDEMARLEGQATRWPERQRLGESIRTTYLVTMGGSKEFNRLVELDVKRREYWIALRGTSLRPDRAAEIKRELITISEEIAALTTVVKTQVARIFMAGSEPQQLVESVATAGLLHLALDGFSSQPASDAALASTAKVGGYTVIDQKQFALVRTPEGGVFQCATLLIEEEGAGITCAATGGK